MKYFHSSCLFKFIVLIIIIIKSNYILLCISQCDVRHIEWTEMTSFGGKYAPSSELDIKIDSLLNLHIKVDLEYIGDSSWHQNRGYGTTYVIDFESYHAYTDRINIPNNCQNRISSSFENKPFSQWWKYSDTPYINGHIGTNNYLAYPPTGNLWNITMLPENNNNNNNNDDNNINNQNKCSTVRYQGLIPWMTLLGCTDKDGNKVVTLTEDSNYINATGTLYVNVVSPYYKKKSYDTGIYRVYQLISQPFAVSFQKMINILSSTKTQLFRMSILAVYKEGNDITNDNYFRLILLTESVEYLKLENPQLIMRPENGINYETKTYSLTESCLVAQSYTCGQLWEIHAKTSCPPTNFSGKYGLTWTAQCTSGSLQWANLCETYLDEYDSSVSLVTELEFIDEFCDPYIYSVIMNGDMYFYKDLYYTQSANDYTFPVGDIIYVEIIVNFPTSTYTIFNTELINVLLCTYPENYNENDIKIDQIKGTGGCLDSNIDADGPYYPFYNRQSNSFNATIHDTSNIQPNTNLIRFSFIVPALQRPIMYVHTHLEITLIENNQQQQQQTDHDSSEDSNDDDNNNDDNNNNNNNDNNNNNTTQRRILLNVNSQQQKKANRMSHFGAITSVTPSPEAAGNRNNNNLTVGTIFVIIGTILGSFIGTAFIVVIILYFYKPQVLTAVFCKNSGTSGNCLCCSKSQSENNKLKQKRSTNSANNSQIINNENNLSRRQTPPIITNIHHGMIPSQRSSRAGSVNVNDIVLDTIVDNVQLDIESQNLSDKLD